MDPDEINPRDRVLPGSILIKLGCSKLIKETCSLYHDEIFKQMKSIVILYSHRIREILEIPYGSVYCQLQNNKAPKIFIREDKLNFSNTQEIYNNVEVMRIEEKLTDLLNKYLFDNPTPKTQNNGKEVYMNI